MQAGTSSPNKELLHHNESTAATTTTQRGAFYDGGPTGAYASDRRGRPEPVAASWSRGSRPVASLDPTGNPGFPRVAFRLVSRQHSGHSGAHQRAM
ncbi:hypothetical protein IscW_ISCW003846 [Ixodes scapularis]|uniref:Uncharacterized protein n=1 Tax=Ixodes scapularis TaxID=6945 RepID=B7PGE9_IXOSC|nr:hypothetical protein IscW_ISCW003846 [Ixodes scapularis]|eukprot:XP_002434271.1 hypothetical protein IscW_ISCW003846 [Ixodes scapularis]